MSYNFGSVGNGQVCDCGRHEGVGHLSPLERAQRYARMRNTMPTMLTFQNKEYLESWEHYHGKVSLVLPKASASDASPSWHETD